ncbi:glycoside hydrolase [Dysgonomonas sp. 216]|uniref:glycoside hydrolase family 3 N-terminal domain-containing protein n=1 Tax=Dysgonomonas sp. 216 TaxID=2302934 RepID=UPI0013D605C9|nr:glycoside hydrolase family 3 N-terminal domain-containing protein [Dysgonomonas sp. 216]NDW18373.1 glycoside hydrolase [Dysgonomonas sp. 216]
MKLKIFFAYISIACLFSSYTHSQNNPIPTSLYQNIDKKKMNQWVDSVFNTMSLDEKIGQTIMVMAAGDNSQANRNKLQKLVEEQHVGSIVFSKTTPLDQAALTNLCQEKAKIPLLIALDGEWGLSMRMDNTIRFPRNMTIGAIQDDSLIFRYGQEVARQCRLMGIHVNFAPAVDINSNPANPVIGTRSFGENPEKVSKYGILYSKGLESGGVMSVAKHFPGHGDTSADSHKELPVINHKTERLEAVEILPFKNYIEAGLSGIMTAHLNIPALDKSGLPSSLSKSIVTDLLQNKLGFTGLIFTDGLAMRGVSTQPDMSMKALLAGNDILLGPISPEKEFNAIKLALQKDPKLEKTIEERCRKVLTYKYILNVPTINRAETDNLLTRLNTSYGNWIARKLNQKSITLLQNEKDLLPLKHLDKNQIAAISIGGFDGNMFHQTLRAYGNVSCFDVSDGSELLQLKSTLSDYNTVIISVHNNKVHNNSAIQSILEEKKGIMVFFTSPYRMSPYALSLKKTDAVIVAYENTPFAQEYAAQAIFGGNSIDGKLPVTVRDLYKEGEGLHTRKIRLSYNLPEDIGIPSEKLRGIDSIVYNGIAEKAFPGCQVLIAKDGVVIYNQSFGKFEYKGDRYVKNTDIYDLASMTKGTATVPAIMKLYDQKKITLQSELSSYIPALKGTDKSKITIRDALLHETGLTSFIPYYMPAIDKNSYTGRLFSNKQSDIYNARLDNNTWGRTDYKFDPKLISTTPKSGFSLQVTENMYANTVYKDSIIGMIAKSKLRSNKNYLYSCLNFMLLKEVVEAEAKTNLNTFLQKNFFDKLGATTTTFNPLNKLLYKDNIAPTERDAFFRKQLIQGFAHDEGAALLGGISGNAGLFSNANDLAKLYQMWLNKGEYGGERYLSSETCKLFTTAKSAKSRRGLGFDKPEGRNNKSSPCSPQTPLNTYGHTGFTGTCFWIDPDNNLIYIFLSNRIYDSRTNRGLMELNIRSRIQEEIYNALRVRN